MALPLQRNRVLRLGHLEVGEGESGGALSRRYGEDADLLAVVGRGAGERLELRAVDVERCLVADGGNAELIDRTVAGIGAFRLLPCHLDQPAAALAPPDRGL